jgi:hypothetical protein
MPSIDELEKGFQASGPQGQPSDLEAGYRTATPAAPAAKPSFLRQLFEPEISGGPIRMFPGVIGGALGGLPGASAGYGLGEYGAQKFQQATGQRPGAVSDPMNVETLPIIGAMALPWLTALGIRLGRGLGRTATRMAPSLFEKAQGKAGAAAAEMVEKMKPEIPAAPLAKAAAQEAERVVGTREVMKDVPSAILTPQGTPAMRTVTSTVEMRPTIPVAATERLAQGITLPAKSANPQMEAVRTTIDNLKARTSGGLIELRELGAIREDIGPLVGRASAPPKLKALYGAMMQDLESAAQSGQPGAALARMQAEAFKRQLGASMLSDLVTQASPQRVISGSNVKALNVATLAKLVHDKKTEAELVKHLGPDALKVVDRFIYDFRALPPDVAFNGWNRMVLTLGGIGGGATAGGIFGGIPGAIIGALTPEVLTNMAMVGKNPQMLNAVMGIAAQGIVTPNLPGAAPPPYDTQGQKRHLMRELNRDR